ncbi:nitrile hydratase subunit beta [Methylocapsa sp. S129]|uniref:nitrile hydratase subunit beta n=1 Tax=Methylocapsa sp. S129 TaxID=1641869 RepID=UPI00131B6031|nr:nitrile hydratase subunit beta [Methylocapsa sp. S129]
MNGAQDLGGMMGFGPIAREPEDRRFHADWEKRAMGLTIAMGATGSWTIDASRHARESLNPADYLASSYYEIWIKAVERLSVAKGLITRDELRLGKALAAPAPVKRVLRRDEVAAALARGTPCNRPAASPAAFKPGDGVRTRNINPAGHTRLPRYTRAKKGVVERVHAAFVFPDANAHGGGEQPQWVYTVNFSARELWGDAADAEHFVSIDAWESYLERA